MSAPPQIPPRPTRAQNTQSPLNDVPKVPPRPRRAIDRSVSPNRNARSPLNDPTFLHNGQLPKDNSQLTPDLPARPPSVSLPSLGEEGIEYASLDDLSKTLTNQSESSPQQTKVAGDLPLHAPKASVPSSTAKSRIQTVTRTDSSQAAAAGFGKLGVDDKAVPSDSGRSASSVGGNTRPSSIYKDKDEEEHGIPEIGVQVPMYPHAGDVQAPTPGPNDPPPSTGIGFFNKGGQTTPRHHSRTKSGREIFHGPPGSYGLHGHGKIGNDEFEQQWYAKHPEDLKREKAGEYGPHIQENRKDYNWESDKLDKLVHAAKGIGMGTSRDAIGTPDEQIGYIASEEYASRMASPRPGSGRPSSIHKSQPSIESPLRHTKFPEDVLTKQKTNESEAEEDVIHIDPPSRRASKIHGGGYDPPTEDLGPQGGNTEEEGGWVTERGYGMPILASDELKKDGPAAEWRQPAVDPELERRTSGEYTVNEDGTPAYLTKARTHSRSSSRNAERQRFVPSPSQFDRSGTPLESTKEYEPLFPEDEDQPKKAKTPVDKLKRPEFARHQFPSQDTWEDAPSSHQLETTVDTPQADEESKPSGEGGADPSQVFEKPETEQARKEKITKEDQQSFLPDHTRRFANKHLEKEYLSRETRPGMQQRFPSQDIWEDTPEQMQLETTVSGPQTPETGDYAEDSPTASSKPSIPPRPSIPARPVKNAASTDKKGPVVPERPKPQVPARPSKPLTKSSEKVPTLSSEEGGEASSQAKAKPPVPARPGGGKIAALQAGFLKDLNSKLGLGPPKVKEPEPEEEKEPEPAKPLSDARKGRAKGPQRRKPTSSPSPAAATGTAEVAGSAHKLAVDIVTTVWSIGDDGELDVPAAQLSAKLHDALKVPGQSKPEDPVASEEVLEKAEHVEPGDLDLEPTIIKDAKPSDPDAAVDTAPEEPDEPVPGQTAGKPGPITADASEAEPSIENVAPGGGVPLEKQHSLEEEIKKEAEEKLAAGGGEEMAKEVSKE